LSRLGSKNPRDLSALALLLVLPAMAASCGGSGASDSVETESETSTKVPTHPQEPVSASVKSVPGSAQVTLTSGSAHDYRIDCYLHPTSVFVSTSNIPLAVKEDGTYTNDVSPRDNGAFMYLIANPPETQVHGQTVEYTSVRDTGNLLVQGDFGNDEGFGGSSDYLEAARLDVDPEGKAGELEWTDTDGSGFTASWECG
jgi:hypothetical protein